MFAVTRTFSPLAKAGMTSRVRLTLSKPLYLGLLFGLSHACDTYASPFGSPFTFTFYLLPCRQLDLFLRKLPRLLRNLVALVFSSESLPFLSALD
jgi:hypothetical protein